MKRKIVSVLLALALCMSLAVSVYAAPDTGFVRDELGYLGDSGLEQLNRLAGDIFDRCGVGIFFVFTDAQSLRDYNVSDLTGGLDDYFIMLENEDSWYTFLGGRGEAIDADKEQALRDIYDEAQTYVQGVEDFLNAAAAYFGAPPDLSDGSEAGSLDNGVLLYDEAELLSSSEESALKVKLLDISQAYQTQIVIATISSMGDGNIDSYVEYFYDTLGIGYGENHDGVLLLVCMNPREYRILSNGMAADAISKADIDSIGDGIVGDLSAGAYVTAFDCFADACAYYLDGHINGFPFEFGVNLIIALAVGIVAGLITVLVLKGQLKTVRKQDQANAYVKAGSMQLTVHSDTFLRREVTRTERANDNDDDNNRSSSSGSSRNVGGGSF